MGATFARLKNWIAEVLSYADLNAEIDNILTNLTPAGVDDYSVNVAQMRVTADPGEVGTESLAQSLAEELTRMRFAIQEIKGGDAAQWYSTASTSLTDLRNALGGTLTNNRVVSGLSSANSSASRFLVASGSTNSLTVKGTATNLVYVIAGTQYSLLADTTITGVSLAPSSNNTCLVNDPSMAAQEISKWIGEDGSTLTIDTVGSEITSLVGKLAAFKIVHGGSTEYFIGFVKSSTQLTNCRRGYFYDSSSAAIPRIAISDNDTITLMRLTWVYAKTDGTIVVNYNNPTYSYSQPSSPSVGDYWYDLANNLWKTFDSITWNTANATLIGICIQNTTATIASRAADFYKTTDDINTIDVEYVGVTQIRGKNFDGRISVGTSSIRYEASRPSWDITADLESGTAEAASTTFYAYIGESGQCKLSTHKPYLDRQGAYKAAYHPYENWRYVARVFNNSGSDFDSETVQTYRRYPARDSAVTADNYTLTATVAANALTIKLKDRDGNDPSGQNPVTVSFRDPTATTGRYYTRVITAPLSIVVPSSATLGHTSAMNQYVWVNLIDDAGVVDMAVSGVSPFFDESIAASTQISAAATSGSVLYSTLSHSGSKAIRLVGRLLSSQATAGTWATAMAEVTMNPVPKVTTVEWTAYTPTFVSFGTVTAISFKYMRIGGSIWIQGKWTNGSNTAVTSTITLPTGFSMNATLFTFEHIGFGAQTGTISSFSVNCDTATNATLMYFSQNSGTYQTKMQGSTFDSSAVNTITVGPLAIAGWSTYGP